MNAFLAQEGGRLAGMAGLLVFSGFFSASETALFSLRREDVDELRRRRPYRGRAVRDLLARPDRLLVSVLFGNLVVNVLYFTLGAGMALLLGHAHGRAAAVGVSLAVLLPLILFGEILPKAVAAASPMAIASLASLPLWAFHRAAGRPVGALTSPLLAAVGALARPKAGAEISPEELRMLVGLAERSGALSGPEAEMIEGVVALSELRVREVMSPRVDVLLLSVSERPEQALRRLKARMARSAPVYEGGIDHVVGVVEAGDLIKASLDSEARRSDLRGVLRPISFVPESARLSALLEQARDRGFDVAVAVDEYGGTAGLVTFEDVVESVFGEIHDEFSAQEGPEVERTASGSYILSGELSVRDWAELFDVEPEPGQFDTLGGFVTYLLGRIPKAGDAARWRNLRFTVRQMLGRRVARVELSLDADGAEAPGAPGRADNVADPTAPARGEEGTRR